MSDTEITFTESVRVMDHNQDVDFEAAAGDCVKVSEASAERWIKRGKAIAGKVKPPKKSASKKEAD